MKLRIVEVSDELREGVEWARSNQLNSLTSHILARW
jgi:hypothetical protein